MPKVQNEPVNDLDSSKPRGFRISLPADVQLGLLQEGWRSYPVAVTGQSWDGFTIRVPESTARRLSNGRHGTLRYQQDVSKVTFSTQENTDTGEVDVTLLLTDESYTKSTRKNGAVAKSGSIQVNQSDSVLSGAVLLGILLLVLALPGWGDQWGTSDYFEDSFAVISRGIYDAMRMFVRN